MTTDNIGGVWTFAVDLARDLKKAGIEVVLAIMGEPLTEKQVLQIEGIEYHFGRFKQEWMPDPWDDIEAAGKWLMGLQEKIRPNLVHLNAYTFGRYRWKAPVLMTIHSDVLSWWQAVKHEPAPAEWDTYRKKVKTGIQAARHISAPSNAMMHAAEEYYGPFLHQTVIYNGRDSETFFPAPKEKFIFSMGRLWDEAKNCRLLLEAAPRIDYPIYIAGDNRDVDSDTVPSNVHFTGQLSTAEIAVYLAGAAVYALPVKYEPFGYTFVEAAFSGCALIGGDVDSLNEIWEEDMTYVDPDDASALASAVNQLMADEEALHAFASNAFKRAHARYRIERMAGYYAVLYRNMLNMPADNIPNRNLNFKTV